MKPELPDSDFPWAGNKLSKMRKTNMKSMCCSSITDEPIQGSETCSDVDAGSTELSYPTEPPRKDHFSVAERSALMGRIRGKDTGPERLLFRLLRERKTYFARHVSALPGKPDVVFRRCRLAVFVDGEFWHGRNYDLWKEGLSSFWRTKIENNMERDRRVDSELTALGWMVIRFWGKDLQRNPEEIICNVLKVRAERVSSIRTKRAT